LFHFGRFRVVDTTYLGRAFSFVASGVVRIRDLRPVLVEELVGTSPEQECVGCIDPGASEPGELLVEVRHLPTAVLEAVVRLWLGFPVSLHDTDKCQMRGHGKAHVSHSSPASWSLLCLGRPANTERVVLRQRAGLR
jgi:hypothetical protein